MENPVSGPSGEIKSMGHRFETPQPLVESLRAAAETVASSRTMGERIDSVSAFMLDVGRLMDHFKIEYKQVAPIRQSKETTKGGFRKKAIQNHPYLGLNGIRLVRDKLSQGVYLRESQDALYLALLDRKLFEETKELTESMSRENRLEELADVYEVAQTLIEARGIKWSTIEESVKNLKIKNAKARRKLSKNGDKNNQ